MAQKILLIDWNSIVKSDKLIRFPVSIDLVRELFGDHAGVWENKEFQEKYENKLNTLFQNMRKSGIEFFSPGGSEFRRLNGMLWWFYIKKSNVPERNSKYFAESYEQYEETYKLDPELFEYLYDEYYQYFKENYIFEVNNDVQRLVDRKPDDWELGIFSKYLTKDELDIILDKLKSVKSYGDAFKLRFGVSIVTLAYAQDVVHSNEALDKEIDKFRRDRVSIFLLYRSPVEWQYFNSDIKHTLLGKEDLMDRFDFDNPGVLLEANDAYQAEEELDEEIKYEQLGEDIPDTVWCNLLKIDISHLSWTFGQDVDRWYKHGVVSEDERVSNQETSNNPKKIAYLHDIVMDKFPFIQRVIDFFENKGELIGGTLIAYSLLVLVGSLISDWLGLVSHYSDVIFYTLAIPFLSWFAVMLLIIVFMLITDIPVFIINLYYKNVNSGLDTTAAIWKAVYPFVMGAIFLVLYSYIP
jgi:hypothetical protein